LKSLDLISLGKGFNDVPSSFGWELVEWKPIVHQIRFETRVRPDEGFVEVVEVVEVEDDAPEEGVGPKINLDLGTGSGPARDFGESLPLFEDYPGDTLEKVGEVDLDEGPQTPSEPVPPIPTDDILTREGIRQKRIKIPAGHTDLPFVRQFLAQQARSSSPSSRLPSIQSKQTLQPTRKSYQLATQGFSRRSSATKQGPLVIEEIKSSPKGSLTKRSETMTSKQALPIPGSEQASTETSPPTSLEHRSLDLVLKERPHLNRALLQT